MAIFEYRTFERDLQLAVIDDEGPHELLLDCSVPKRRIRRAPLYVRSKLKSGLSECLDLDRSATSENVRPSAAVGG